MIRDVPQSSIQRLEDDLQASLLLRMTGQAGRLAFLAATDWQEVRAALEHQQPRPTRPCPYCSGLGMPDATRCGYCWRALTPLPGSPSQGTHARGGDGQARSALASFENEGGALGEGGHELRNH